MYMKKDKILKFIELILNHKSANIITDPVSIGNYNQINQIIKENDLIVFKDFKYIIEKSEPIILKMFDNYQLFKCSFLNKVNEQDINYQIIRKELHNYPGFNEAVATDIIIEINKVKKRYDYILQIDDIKINLFFYSIWEDTLLFQNLARIIYLFIKTFGKKSNIYNNYNIRFLLIDFPRILNKDCADFKEIGEKGYFNNSSGVHIMSKKELVVSRKSGLIGLLIHELIHMVGLDFCLAHNISHDNVNHVNLENWKNKWVELNNIKKVDNNIVSFIEAICNTTSSYFLSIYNTIYLCDKLSSREHLLKYFKYFYYTEVIYCYINGAKLLNYFGYKTYDSFFNNTSNRLYYQNALVFEYVIMRMFLIDDYYNLILKDMLEYDFNERTSKDINLKFQIDLNNKLLDNVQNKSIKNTFDIISKQINNTNGESMEYFSIDINIIKQKI
jgi:hypothetical protein